MNEIQYNRLLKNTVEILKSYLKEINYNQEQFSDILGISQGSLSAALNGNSKKGIKRIADYLIEKGVATYKELYEDVPEIESDFELSVWKKLNDMEEVLQKIVQLQLSTQISNERNFAELKGFTEEE